MITSIIIKNIIGGIIMSNYFKLQIKVKKLNDGEFEDQKQER